MCDCFYLHGQSGDRVSVGSTVFVYSPSTLLDREPTTRLVPCSWAVRVDHDVTWLAVGFDKNLYFCIGFSSWSFTVESRSRVWTQLGVFPSPLLAWALWGRTHAGLTVLLGPSMTCQSTPLVDFYSIVEWILGILHSIEIRFDLLHLMSCLNGWQVQ